MLTRIEIDGFKTFKDFALDVPPFLVVLGQNAAGKSNLFDAIAFLARLAQGATVMQAVRESRGDLSELLHRDSIGRRVSEIRFAVDLGGLSPEAGILLDGGLSGEVSDVRYALELQVQIEDPSDPEGTQSLAVSRERWWAADRGADGKRSPWVEVPYTPESDAAPRPEHPASQYPAPTAFRPSSDRDGGVFQVTAVQRLIGAFRDEIAAWRVLALEPSALRQPDSYDDDDVLSPSGAHLPNTLARIVRRTRTEDWPEGALSDIKNDLATVIPEVIDLRVIDVKELRSRSLAVTAKGEGEFTAQAASDGTLRALALVTALSDPRDKGLLCVEEPENGVFPQRLGRLIQLLSGAAGAGTGHQVVVSSHSPAVLDALAVPVDLPLREDVVFLSTASRVLDEPGTLRRVTVARSLRADTSVPLPPDRSGPVMSRGEIDAFLGVRALR